VGKGNSSRSAIRRRWLVKRARASLGVLSWKTLTDRSSLDLGHGVAEVVDHLRAEQIERRIREREDAQRTRDFETYCVHNELLFFPALINLCH
jgi:hypothetical protein